MTKIDQFESAFKASAKEAYSYSAVELKRGLVITDLDAYEARLCGDEVRSLLRGADPDGDIEWRDVAGSEFQTVRDLLDLVESERPDLVCSYRNLQSGAWRWPFSLGSHLEVLTQVTRTPVVVMPRPQSALEGAGDERPERPRHRGTPAVMAITDHLTGDHRLVDWAARFEDAHDFAARVPMQPVRRH